MDWLDHHYLIKEFVIFSKTHRLCYRVIPEIRPVWAEAFRVLRPGGILVAGFINPFVFTFGDHSLNPELRVIYALPFSEVTSISPDEHAQIIAEGDTLQFSHTLTDQLAGQMDAGFVLVGFFEDYQAGHPAAAYIPTHMATRALKPHGIHAVA